MHKFGMTTIALVTMATATAGTGAAPESDAATTLWYETPGTEFTQGLPLGNGRLGMTILGDPAEERIVLNEESMWNGSPVEDNRPDAHRVLPKIRELLLEGENKKAHDLVNQTFTCAGAGGGSERRPDGKHYGFGRNVPFGCFQTLGNLRLKHTGKVAVKLKAQLERLENNPRSRPKYSIQKRSK